MTVPCIYDTLIIGSGGAGLSLALRLADHARVLVFSKVSLNSGSTYHAQGGISAVLDADDSIESHIKDTLKAGAGLCNLEAVHLTVSHGKENVEWLKKQGVEFTEEQSTDGKKSLHLNREGGHSHRRIVHTADATGKAVSQTLVDRALEHPNISLLENQNVIDLIISHKQDVTRRRIQGVYVLDTLTNKVKSIAVKTVVLATGGASSLFVFH
jgi:L-aspartate oxidase